MSWGQGQPVMVLSSQAFDFKGEDGTPIRFTRYAVVIDDNPPKDGRGFVVHEARADATVEPGYYYAQVSYQGGAGNKKMHLNFLGRIGDLPDFTPPTNGNGGTVKPKAA
jgi:hypothetical protein